MNKELFGFLLLLIALIIGAIYYTNAIQEPFITSLNYLKTNYHDGVEYTQDNINKYFFQADEITKLNDQLEDYEKKHLLMQQLASEINDLYKENNSTLKINPEVELVRTISYEKFSNFNRVWVDIKDYNASKIYGLTYKEIVAGIVVEKNNRPLAILNKDDKCTYAVHVGLKHAPGIAEGTNGENIVVKYIPAWFEINDGDEVVTSGLDNIFFKGLKVGKVISSSKAQGYQTAIVEPYYHPNDPNYFHMIKRER